MIPEPLPNCSGFLLSVIATLDSYSCSRFECSSPDDERLAPFMGGIDRWVEGIDAGKSLVPSLREGVYSQLLMDLSHEANERHCWVEVPELEQYLGI